jgi:hypothetical protein
MLPFHPAECGRLKKGEIIRACNMHVGNKGTQHCGQITARENVLGRSRHRREYNNITALEKKSFEGVDRLHLGLDGDHQRLLLNTVIRLRVPLK